LITLVILSGDETMQENQQYWIKITCLPPVMTSHMLLVVLMECFALTSITCNNIFMIMVSYNDATRFSDNPSNSSFTVSVSSPAVLAALWLCQDALSKELAAFIETCDNCSNKNLFDFLVSYHPTHCHLG
jgi:hypothetical protein